MLFTKAAVLTCLFYLLLNLLLEAALLGLAHWQGVSGIHFQRGGRYVFFGLIWLVSFSLSWRIIVPGGSGDPCDSLTDWLQQWLELADS